MTIPTTPPSPGTCAVVMYTSGSTGKPKGVVITHQNLLASVTGALTLLKPQDGDVYLGYLPLAHILELMAELGMLSCGIPVCFADPKTLTSTGSYPIGALEAFSPSLMAGGDYCFYSNTFSTSDTIILIFSSLYSLYQFQKFGKSFIKEKQILI